MIKIHVGILAALLLAGCGSKTPPPSGPALIWARSADSGTLDPAEIEWGEDAKITQNIFEPLITFKGDTVELEGCLAKSWKFSPDGKTLTFELRDGVKFHDGTTFDSGDVEFTFNRLLDAAHPNKPKVAPYASFFAVIAGVKADGPNRVVFTLKTPGAVILHILTLFGAGIVSPEAVKKHGDKWSVNPAGTGPYRLARWERDVKMVLERFPGYWGPKPAIEKVIVVPVLSPQTAIEKLKLGEVHVVDHVTMADVKPLQDDPNTRVDFETSMNVGYLGFNMKKAPYNNPDFRRAVSLALDRNSLNTLVYFGLGETATNIVPPAIYGVPTPPYEYNIEKAKEHLAKARLESNSVELIHMTFARAYFPEPQRVAEWVKDQLRKIGLEVKLTGYDKAAYTPMTKSDDHPMYLMGWNADYPDPDNFFYPLLHGNNAGDLNGSHFKDPEFDQAVLAAQEEVDAAKRKALYAKAYDRYRDQMPTLPIIHVRQLIAFSKRVEYNMHPIEYRFYIARFRE